MGCPLKCAPQKKVAQDRKAAGFPMERGTLSLLSVSISRRAEAPGYLLDLHA